jgi:4-hydroxy-3-methylbut-2-enyl diphosphate reductase
MEVTRASRRAQECILIGHHGHPEVVGTMGQYNNEQGGIYLVESPEDVAKLTVKDTQNLCYSSQTTLSVDDTAHVINALREKFPEIEGPRKDDICYATQNRQDAVKDLAEKTELVLVVGSPNSSNSNRLREKACNAGVKAYLIDNESDIKSEWLSGVNTVGVTAGASAPDVLVQAVIQKLKLLGGGIVVENPGVEENIVFEVPAELRIKQVD